MKSFNATWRASDWGEDEPDGVTVYRPGEESWDHLISHERQIEDAIPDAPDDLKSWVRVEVMANRELGENEFRGDLCDKPDIYTLDLCGEGVRWRGYLLGTTPVWTRAMLESERGKSQGLREDLRTFALAYLDKHAPKLAENEVRDDKGMIWQLRWDCGVAECKLRERVAWNRCENMGSVPAALAWFRAHCPIDRFVTDEGEVLRFEMLDDGEAKAFTKSGVLAFCTGVDDTMCPDLSRTLYRFRDHERGKWLFSHSSPPKTNRHYLRVLKNDGREWILGEEGWRSDAGEEMPTWVRQKAEALYREKNPEWRVEWRNDTSGGNAAVYQGRDYAGCFSKLGASTRVGTKTWPTHILTEARAKFRENYREPKETVDFEWPESENCWNAVMQKPPVRFRGRRVRATFEDLGPCAGEGS